jgi:hypothetical protein
MSKSILGQWEASKERKNGRSNLRIVNLQPNNPLGEPRTIQAQPSLNSSILHVSTTPSIATTYAMALEPLSIPKTHPTLALVLDKNHTIDIIVIDMLITPTTI